eukprot:gene533-8045_t
MKFLSVVANIFGIYVVFILVAMYGEKILTVKYISNTQELEKEIFTSPLFVVFLVSTTVSLYSLIKNHVKIKLEEKLDIENESLKLLGIASFFRFLANALSSSSVLFIGYLPTVVIKSCKPIPILLANILIGKKKYSIKKFLTIVFICAGTIIFMIYSLDVKKKEKKETKVVGFLMLIGSLICDGLVAGFQGKVENPNVHHFLLYMNLFSIGYAFIGALITSQFISGFLFFVKYPHIIFDTFIFLTLMTIGQELIYYSIVHFGNLFTSVVTTTRKMITILLSIVWFSHHLNIPQIIGIIIVFIFVILDFFVDKNEHGEKIKIQIDKEKEMV